MLMISHEYDPMLPGDTFAIGYNTWYREVHQGYIQDILCTTDRKVNLEVTKLFIRSPHELRYVCRCEGHRQLITIAHILVPLYEVKVWHPELQVSALVLAEAAFRANARWVSPDYPNLYTKEDAERVMHELMQLSTIERHGFVIPEYLDIS